MLRETVNTNFTVFIVILTRLKPTIAQAYNRSSLQSTTLEASTLRLHHQCSLLSL